ncbi:hypothetical protein KUTeg_002501 [Tegillarca granosa]|uniref:Uncharacterized protein n=1 Tax=Tegillarca granosa TaxID=220873 RepID=A0ABQ9FUG9_TEGGR|nr:hypothetical protein KUTeg_002501 [Tegillarca granosa]
MAKTSRSSTIDDCDEDGKERKDVFCGTSTGGVSNFVSGRSEELVKVKVVVVGDMAVGKTSLSVRFTEQKFEDKYMQTVGASFYVRAVELKGKKIIFQIWDTAGQERFRSLVPMYLRDTGIALLVYDVTDMASFHHVREWLKELRNSAPEDAILTLVGNKIDLLSKKKVHSKEAEDFACEKGMKFYETSAKTGENIEALFNDLAYSILHMTNDNSHRTSNIVNIKQNNAQIPTHLKCCH